MKDTAANTTGKGGLEGGEGECENYVHCAMLGDGMVGKTSLTLSHTQQVFTDCYTTTVFDNYPVPIQVAGKDFVISLFDTSGDSSHESLRAFTYQTSEVLLLCFCVCDRVSFFNIVNVWLPEIKRHTNKSKLPIILVGTQVDQRPGSSPSSSRSSCSSSSPPSSPFSSQGVISREEGQQLADMIGADCYIECSARSGEGLQQVFDHVVFSALKYRRKKGKLINRLLRNLSKLTNPLKNLSPPRFFRGSRDVSCC